MAIKSTSFRGSSRHSVVQQERYVCAADLVAGSTFSIVVTGNRDTMLPSDQLHRDLKHPSFRLSAHFLEPNLSNMHFAR